jgi:hypothetical protein
MNDLSEKKINLDEFLLKCAEWTAEIVDTYNFKPYPARPEEMSILDDMPPDKRNLLSSEFYEVYPQILSYSRLITRIKWENKTLYDWLMECRRLLMENEKIEAARKIDQKLQLQEV